MIFKQAVILIIITFQTLVEIFLILLEKVEIIIVWIVDEGIIVLIVLDVTEIRVIWVKVVPAFLFTFFLAFFILEPFLPVLLQFALVNLVIGLFVFLRS